MKQSKRPGCNLWVAAIVAAVAMLAGCDARHEAQAAAKPSAFPLKEKSGKRGPVTLDACGEPQTYVEVPQRAITHDVNITEMFLFLGLQDKLVGYSGIPSTKEIDPELRPVLDKIPNLSSQGMNLEAIVGAHADFVFGGWSYGFRQGAVTPELLSRYGIASYVLTESCIRIKPRERVSMDDSLLDLRNIARIFDIADQAEPRIHKLEMQLKALLAQTQGVKERPKVFVYDSGQDIPVTVGRFGMPQAMIEAAGGRNIFDDIPNNWPRGSWEDVIERDPEWIVIIDYGVPSAQGKIDFLLQKQELSSLAAIRKKQFFAMTYAQATPGPRNIEVAQELAHKLHPERFSTEAGKTAKP